MSEIAPLHRRTGVVPLVASSASSVGPEGFSAVANFVAASALVVVRGELDLATAPALESALIDVIERGARSLVLDVADLTFMDACGLRVLIAASNRVHSDGGTLSLRAVPKRVRWLLEFAGLTHLAEALQDEAHDDPGREQTGEALLAAAVGVAWPAKTARDRTPTAIPADNDTVDDALRLVVALARATVGGADGVSVSLRRQGRLRTVAASDQTITAMDADQYATGEGPCVSASVEGRWFHVESLDDEERWPDFIPQAKSLGINSILSAPLTASGTPIGALNIYSRTSGAFTPPDLKLATMFATEASTILTGAGVDVTPDELAGRLQHALQTRQDIAQAQGLIMGRDDVNLHEAYATLRRLSVNSDVPLADIARDLVSSAAMRTQAFSKRPL